MAGPRPASHSDGPDTGTASSFLPLLAKPGWLGSASQAWMITFTDLVALMLAFFVLLFAMSQVEQKKWQGLVDSLSADLNGLKSVEHIKPALDYHPEDQAVVPGADLDYLAPVLRQQIAAHALLARGTIRRLPDRLVVSLPADLLFRANATTLAPEAAPGARDAGFALGGVLRYLNNRIEVVARIRHSDRAQGRRSDWQLALARAALFTSMLTRAGYRGPIVARGIVESRAGRRAPASSAEPGRLQGDRLDIVIHEFAREPQ